MVGEKMTIRKVETLKAKTRKSTYYKNRKVGKSSDARDAMAYLTYSQNYKKAGNIDAALAAMMIAKNIIDNALIKLKKKNMKYFLETL